MSFARRACEHSFCVYVTPMCCRAAWTDKLKDTAGRVKEGVADTAQIAKKHGEEMHMDVKCAADDHVRCPLQAVGHPLSYICLSQLRSHA